MANASDANIFFGYELLNKLCESQLTKKEDVIILFAHWYFVRNGFKCIGTGDSPITLAGQLGIEINVALDLVSAAGNLGTVVEYSCTKKTFEPSERGSELLPSGWNQSPNYSLRYLKEGKLYLLLGTKSDADVLLNLLRVEDNSVSNIHFPIENTVNSLRGSLESQIPTYRTILNIVRTDLVEPVYAGRGMESSTQTPASNVDNEREFQRREPAPDYDPLRVGPPRGPLRPHPDWNPDADVRSVGRSDLDPFSRGGGMIFDPFSPGASRNAPGPLGPGGLGVPGRLPLGAVPPGARFDPFGPPDIARPRPRQGPPDSDHMPPPGYDDMFM